jgi:hypothetical protein
MPTRKTKTRKVTIDYGDSVYGKVELDAIVILHRHNSDGSEFIVMETQPKDDGKIRLTGNRVV